jgi:hypothetical protein
MDISKQQEILNSKNIYQYYLGFKNLLIYILWGNELDTTIIEFYRGKNEELEYDKLKDVTYLHQAIFNISNDDNFKKFNFDIVFENTKKNDRLYNMSKIQWVLSLFKNEKPIIFPNTDYDSNYDICKFLMKKKMDDPEIIQKNKDEIQKNPLTLKFYKRDDIKKIRSEISKIDVFEDEIDKFFGIFDSAKGGGLFFDEPDKSDTKCYDFWNDIQKQITNYTTDHSISRIEAYKIIRKRMKLVELQKILECKNKKDYDQDDMEDSLVASLKYAQLLEEHDSSTEEYTSRRVVASSGQVKDDIDKSCDAIIKSKILECDFKKLIRNDKLIKKINLYIQLFKLINDPKNIDKLILLFEKYNEQKKEILSSIDDEFKVNGELNELGKCIYKFYATGKKPEQKLELEPEPIQPEEITILPKEIPIQPRKWVKPGNRIQRSKGIYNPSQTCYMNSLFQAINATDYLYIDLLWTIHSSGILLPLTRYFDNTLRKLRDFTVKDKLIHPVSTFCEVAWDLMGHKGQDDSIMLFNNIKRDIENRAPITVVSPIYKGISYTLKEINGFPKKLQLQEFIDATIQDIVNTLNINKKKIFDKLQENMKRYLENVDKRDLFSQSDVNPYYAKQNIIQLARENQIDELRRLLNDNRDITNQQPTYENAQNISDAYIIVRSINNALKAIRENNVEKLSEQEENDYYLPSDIFYRYIKDDKGDDAMIPYTPDERINKIQEKLNESFTPINKDTLNGQDRILGTTEYKPYIILENHKKIHTTNNCNINIHGQNFTLKAIIIKYGDNTGGHYETYTSQGQFNDQNVVVDQEIFTKYCREGHRDATFYFFENVNKPTSFIAPETDTFGGAINNKYYSKYLKYKNKYLELSKLKKSKY